MRTEKLFAVTIRVAAVKEICVEAMDVGDAEKLAHGLFTVEDCDPRTLVQETVGVQCCGSAAVRKKSKPWVIVENAGTDMEISVDEFSTYDLALKCKRRHHANGDIMKRTSHNSLTTEF